MIVSAPRISRGFHIPVGLYLGTIEMAALHGIDTLFVLTEPRLAGHFSKLGVKTRQIGRFHRTSGHSRPFGYWRVVRDRRLEFRDAATLQSDCERSARCATRPTRGVAGNGALGDAQLIARLTAQNWH